MTCIFPLRWIGIQNIHPLGPWYNIRHWYSLNILSKLHFKLITTHEKIIYIKLNLILITWWTIPRWSLQSHSWIRTHLSPFQYRPCAHALHTSDPVISILISQVSTDWQQTGSSVCVKGSLQTVKEYCVEQLLVDIPKYLLLFYYKLIWIKVAFYLVINLVPHNFWT